MKEAITSIFSNAKGTISSKRVFGGIGFTLVMCVIVYLVIINKEEPQILSEFMFTCAGLLGLDSVTDIWKGAKNLKDNNEQSL